MRTFRQLGGVLLTLWLGVCTAAFAVAPSPPPIPVTSSSVAGLAGSIVKPSFSLDVDGFAFESFDLTLSFSNPLLSFDLESSRVHYNGDTMPWTALPGYSTPGPRVTGDVGSFQLSALTIEPPTFSGVLVLQPAFRIRDTAPLGNTTVSITGSVGSDRALGERYYDSSATVSAVPEPEIWLLWLGGLGLLAWKRKRRSP